MEGKSRRVAALRFYNRGNLRVEQVEPQKCGPDDVRLSIAYCGICGSDLGEYTDGPLFTPHSGTTNPFTGSSLPITLGHEFVGTVTECGTNVRNLSIGQAVAVSPTCGHQHHGLELCNCCKESRYNICEAMTIYGIMAPGGGFCEESVVSAMNCLPIAPNVSMEAAALIDPLAVAHHSIKDSDFRKGQTVLICGAGPIGLAILSILRVLGASNIIVTEILEVRMEKAREFGADAVINPKGRSSDLTNSKAEDEALGVVRELMGDGVDVVFDATGLQSTLNLAIASVKPRGTIVNVAIHKRPLEIDFNSVTLKEARLTGSVCYLQDDLGAVMTMLENGSLEPEKLITSVVPLSRVIQDGFEELVNNAVAHVKILVRPDQKE